MFNPGKFDNDVAIYRKPIGTSAMLGRVYFARIKYQNSFQVLSFESNAGLESREALRRTYPLSATAATRRSLRSVWATSHFRMGFSRMRHEAKASTMVAESSAKMVNERRT